MWRASRLYRVSHRICIPLPLCTPANSHSCLRVQVDLHFLAKSKKRTQISTRAWPCSARANTALDMPKRKRHGGQGGVPPGGHGVGPPGLGARPALAAVEMPLADTSSTARQYMTDVRFDSLPLTAETKRALNAMQYETCTNVQAASMPVFLSGKDLVVKAKTGTGKTLAFLIPAIERLKQQPKPARGRISIVVLSPTRELAYQIAEEAGEVVRSHGLVVQSVVGGTSVGRDTNLLSKTPPDVLVATPGRMTDLLESQLLAKQLVDIQCLIFDEADRLLDMGFKPSIDRILSFLPPKERRQTALFSATFPRDIQRLAQSSLRAGFEIVDTVGETEDETAEKIQQSVVSSSMSDLTATTLSILREHQSATPGYKVMVFFTTAKLTAMYASLFSHLGLPVQQMHSRMSQSQRNKAADAFRQGQNTMLFTSDVSARGVDYPDVTLVLQVGLPASRDQYIHRVGRTARAGKKGEAILILQDFEKAFLRKLQGLPVNTRQAIAPEVAQQLEPSIKAALANIPKADLTSSYQAWLGYYNSSLKMLGWNSRQLVDQANEFARNCLGQSTPPPIMKKTVGKMGLKGVPGLNVVASLDNSPPRGSKGGNSQKTRPAGQNGQPLNPSRPPVNSVGKQSSRGREGRRGY